jgi:hypothetical protein
MRKLSSAISTGLVIMLLLFSQFGMARMNPCPKSELELVHIQECISSGLIIKKMDSGALCWEKVECKEGHLHKEAKENNYCGEMCKCPEWAEGCSFYDGPTSKNSSMNNKKLVEILENEKIKICSL